MKWLVMGILTTYCALEVAKACRLVYRRLTGRKIRRLQEEKLQKLLKGLPMKQAQQRLLAAVKRARDGGRSYRPHDLN